MPPIRIEQTSFLLESYWGNQPDTAVGFTTKCGYAAGGGPPALPIHSKKNRGDLVANLLRVEAVRNGSGQ